MLQKNSLIFILIVLLAAACSTPPGSQLATQPSITTTVPVAEKTVTVARATDMPSPTHPLLPTPTTTPVPPPPAITLDNVEWLSQTAVQDFTYDKGGVYGMAWSPDSAILAVSTKLPQGITLYDSGLNPIQFIGSDAVMYAPAFSLDGALVAAGGSDGLVRVWQVSDGTLLRELEGHAGPAWANVAFSPDGAWLASGGMDLALRLWPLAGGESIVLKHMQPVTSLAFSPDGKWLASSSGYAISFWDAASMATMNSRPLGALPLQTESAPVLCFLDDGILATAGLNSTLRLWQIASEATFQVKEINELPYNGISLFAPNADKTLLAIGGERSSAVRLVNLSTGETARELAAPGEVIVAIAFSPDGSHLAVSTDRPNDKLGTVSIWSIPKTAQLDAPADSKSAQQILPAALHRTLVAITALTMVSLAAREFQPRCGNG